MKKLSIYDPSLCCSTGVCGVDVDQALVDTSANVDWLKSQGADVERFNLSHQPMAFVENATVKALLEEIGENALPVIMLDGDVVAQGRYPARDELAGWLGLESDGSASTEATSNCNPASGCC